LSPIAWRFALLGGLTAGLAASPFAAAAPVHLGGLGAACAVLLAVARPPTASSAARAIWLVCLAGAAAAVGLWAGAARLAAIDAGALDLPAGERVSVEGFVAAVPRRAQGEVRVRVETADGRLLVSVPEPVADLPVGSGVRAEGTIRDPADWERAYLERLGVRDVLVAPRLEPLAARRGGVAGALDEVRGRAEAALGTGTEPAAAALVRGFVLGQDDRIDAGVIDEFKRSGLAHLLAVSGQNVLLLAVLATVVLGALGVPVRARLAWVLVLIAVYVPIAGAGASIQRAGVMGAAGVVAALASRPRSRWYVLLLAAAATLAVNPRSSGDVGWQLSFVAVVGILAWSRPLADLLGRGLSGIRRATAEGVAMTVAATLATAPLMAHHFGTASVVALPANLIALPAVAPVMWLGMLAAAAGQLPWIPVEPLSALAGVLAGFIAQVASWFAAPGWALAKLELPGGPALAAVYAALVVAVGLALRWWQRRRALRTRLRASLPRTSGRRAAALVAVAGAIGAGAIGWRAVAPPADRAPPGLVVRVLDVGQGDAILLEPERGDPVLVDAGPASAEVVDRLDELGVERLAAAVATHPQDDHVGGLPEVLERVETERLVLARSTRALLGAARAAGTERLRVEAGDRLRFGRLRLEVLWPPPERLRRPAGRAGPRAEDPNTLSLVVLARWRRFELLLTGDAEAEVAPIEPGRVDALKLAHHGSADAGLATLLERAQPALGLVSVGADNPYGHPAPATLAELEAAEVPVLRTDLAGEIVLEVDDDGWRVR
jgi:competence protein ComEC